MSLARAAVLALSAAVAALLAAPVAAQTTAAPPSPLAALDFLAGSCFLGTFADGKTQDFICYEWTLGGKFLRSRHRVLGAPAPYSGETMFGIDAGTGALEFHYFNSEGGVMRGEVVPTAEGFAFPIETVETQGKSLELRSTWRRTGDGYVAITEERAAGAWRPFMTITFVRHGDAASWSEP